MSRKIAGWFGLQSTVAAHGGPPFGFHGGLALDPAKQGLHKPIANIALPGELVVPLLDYHFNAVDALVNPGDAVTRGQWLAHAIPSPASGTVLSLEHHPVAHPSLLEATCARIALDEKQPGASTAGTTRNLPALLESAGVSGLGGAAFPLVEKLRSIGTNNKLETLIINAAECEPGIACDEALMQEQAQDIVDGIHTLARFTGCDRCIIAMEDSKPRAEQCMRAALGESVPEDTAPGDLPKAHNATAHSARNIRMLVIPTRYPTGAENTLIRVVTGKRVSPGQLPTDVGVLCVNVATALAVSRACQGQALDSRIVSLTGDNMPEPCNVRVRFGTPVQHVLEQTGNAEAPATVRLRIGGALSGFDITSNDTPVTANCNCIRADRQTSRATPQACIRCGACADVCPEHLLPQQLHWFAQSDNIDACREYKIDACIECGCCDLVCPSSIPLTDMFRYAKSKIKNEQQKHADAMLAEQRFDYRETRLRQREAARAERIEQRKQQLKAKRDSTTGKGDSDIKAALARARARKNKGRNQ